jgi:hypothetical protein
MLLIVAGTTSVIFMLGGITGGHLGILTDATLFFVGLSIFLPSIILGIYFHKPKNTSQECDQVRQIQYINNITDTSLPPYSEV